MPERRKYDVEFRERAVTIVRETGQPIAEVARDLGIGPRPSSFFTQLPKVPALERENAELRMERDVLKRSVVLWVKEVTR